MNEPWVEAISPILRGVPPLRGALCRQRPELFDGDNNEDTRQSAALCARCPAREPCAAWADKLRHNQIDGVVAGERREWISHPSLRREKATQ